jgi:hypothetical protein
LGDLDPDTTRHCDDGFCVIHPGAFRIKTHFAVSPQDRTQERTWLFCRGRDPKSKNSPGLHLADETCSSHLELRCRRSEVEAPYDTHVSFRWLRSPGRVSLRGTG